MLHDGEAIRGITAAPCARLLRQRDEAQAVEHPARDRQHARVGEVIEVVVERLDRVERVLGQRVRAGRRGGPGVDERRLDDVVSVGAPPHEAAPVVDRDRDVGVGVDAAGVVAERAAHHVVGDDRIDLDAVDVRRAEHQRREEVASAAGSDDERAKARCAGWRRGLAQVIGERRQLVAQRLDVCEIAVETEDRRRGRRVDVHEPRCRAAGRYTAGLSDQSPCPRSYTPMRENEFHLLKSTRSPLCPFVSRTSKGAALESCTAAGTPATSAAAIAMRARRPGACSSTAAIAAVSDATSTAPGAPTVFSSGISSRQPAAAPMRSAAYTTLTPVAKRVIASETTDAAREERQRGERVDREHQAQVLRRVVEPDPEAHQQRERNHGHGREHQGVPGQQARRLPGQQPAPGHEHVHAAGAQPEERDRNGQKREVVIHRDREDARERELGHQQRGGGQRDCRDRAAAERWSVRWWHP